MGAEQERRSLQMEGLNLMDKTLFVQGARLSFRIWDVGGECIEYCSSSCTSVHINSVLSLFLQRIFLNCHVFLEFFSDLVEMND